MPHPELVEGNIILDKPTAILMFMGNKGFRPWPAHSKTHGSTMKKQLSRLLYALILNRSIYSRG